MAVGVAYESVFKQPSVWSGAQLDHSGHNDHNDRTYWLTHIFGHRGSLGLLETGTRYVVGIAGSAIDVKL